MTESPDTAAVRDELNRMLQGKGFVGAHRASRLLRHVVERTLNGQADQLKEYSLGVEVFDRDDAYDPRIDSIVRVEAGRLRSKIEEYYAGDGAGSPVRIALPKGSYVPVFSHRPAPPVAPPAAPVTAARARAFWPLAVGLTTLILVAVWFAADRVPSGAASNPSIVVLPFEAYSADASDAALAAGLTSGVTAELAKLGTLSVVSRTTARQYESTRQPLRDIAAAVDADFVMEASVEVSDGVSVQARLVNASTDRKFWVQDFRAGPGGLQVMQQQIAAAVNAAVSGR